MGKVTGDNLKKLVELLNDYIEDNQSEIDTNIVAGILNDFIDESEKLYSKENLQKGQNKLLYTTGAGNTIMGGSDIWTNYFLQYIWPTLPIKKTWKLLIDSKRPLNFNPNSLPKGLQYHFHFDDPTITEKWLNEAQEIHVLHPHYHKRPHIWHYEDKFKTVFVHAYARDIVKVLNKIPELKQLQVQTNVDENFYEDFLVTFKKRIWIGNNHSGLLDDFPNYTYTIPNFYEFVHNLPLTTHIDNGKIGFASRAETRKCLHWLNGHKGYALTSQFDVKNLRDSTSYSLNDIDIYQWDPDIHHQFMLKNWGIFHGAYFNEPFGYSIFQAVDYGKLPILNKDWAPEIDYKYRVETKNEFDSCVKEIVNDSYEIRNAEFQKLKEYMKKFDNKNEWIDKVRTTILS